MYTHNYLMCRYQHFFKGFSVTNKQYNILRILKGANKPVSTSYIKERMLDQNSDVSRIVDRMATKDFVKKNACETDKRLVDVVLTLKGQTMLDKIKKEMDVRYDVLENLTISESEQLNALLDKLRGNK